MQWFNPLRFNARYIDQHPVNHEDKSRRMKYENRRL
jgi:hypothetical protein